MKSPLWLLLPALLLSGCGDDDQTVVFDWETSDLVFSYPYDGQQAVPVTAPIALRFSHPLTYVDQTALDADIAARVVLTNDTDPATPLGYSAKMVDGGMGLLVTPDERFAPAAEYTLTITDLMTEEGVVSFPGAPIEFSTRIATSGPTSVRTAGAFDVARVVPDGTELPVMDFSDFRLQFSGPVDRESVAYGDQPGDSVSLLDSSGTLVEAQVLIKDAYVTVDPLSDLVPGETYTLAMTSDVQSSFGEALPAWSMEFVPGDSNPRAVLVQAAAVSADNEADQCTANAGVVLSPLTGDAINCVPVKSTLLGDDSASQQQGDVYAELAFVPNYPVVTPLRVARGSLLQGSNVDLLIAGEVPAGFGTDTISVAFISDAVGYLLPNAYSTAEDSPRHVRLLMDVAMTAQDTRANGGLSQDIMHVELAGIAIVIDGILTIDAVGVVEPNILGVDEAYGVLSFHMEAYADQANAPPQLVDTTAPQLQSWVPGINAAKQSSENPIILNFSEVMDPQTLVAPDAVMISKDGVPLDSADWRYWVDGSSMVIRTNEPLAYSSTYTLTLSPMLADLAGNTLVAAAPLAMDYTLSFDMPNYIGVPSRSPLALTVYPGFPCVTESRDLAAGDHGICAGGLTTDDHLPVTTLAENRGLAVQFSQDMDADSIVLGGSFRVEQQNGAVWDPVDGELLLRDRSLVFFPTTPWQSDGAQLYRYVLGSQGPAGTTPVNCDGSLTICDVNGLPLQTRVLAQDTANTPDPDEGGPDMEIYFVGGPASQTVLQPARNLPATDVNANQIHEGRTAAEYDEATQSYPVCDANPDDCEDLPEFDVGSGLYITPKNSTKIVENGVGAGNSLLTQANVGCGFTGNLITGYTPRSCPERKFVYLTGALNVELLGPVIYPPTGETAVQVNVLPTLLMTSSLDFYAIATLVGEQFSPTGPMIMRVRYGCDDPLDATCADGNDTSDLRDRNQAVTGYVLDTPEGPVFEVSFELYLDAPQLDPLNLGFGASIHNQHSFPLSLTLRGPINFLDDGRMEVEQTNDTAIDLAVEVAGDTINVVIPAGGVNLNYTTAPAKR